MNITGFLIAGIALGPAVQALSEASVHLPGFWLFVFFLCVVGFILSFATLVSVSAATEAIEGLKELWLAHLKRYSLEGHAKGHFPSLTGGNEQREISANLLSWCVPPTWQSIVLRGKISSFALPLVFCVIWPIIAAIALAELSTKGKAFSFLSPDPSQPASLVCSRSVREDYLRCHNFSSSTTPP